MGRWEREGLRSAESGLCRQVGYLLDAYERQRFRLSEVYRRLEALRLQGGSPDRSMVVAIAVGFDGMPGLVGVVSGSARSWWYSCFSSIRGLMGSRYR